MYKLNLPPFQIRASVVSGRPKVLDRLRRRYVALTPEEWVRQHFVNFLIEHKGYPQAYLANEVELRVGDKRLRCDSVLYNNVMRPRMIVEYKAPDIKISQAVFDQITVYNFLLKVDYRIVSNGLQHFCCKMDYENDKYIFLDGIPDYRDL